MIKDFLLPDLGEGIESAEVSEILVSSGDEVEVNQTLFVLESDKASMEIPAEVSGVVKEVLIKVGDEIKTGQLLLKIETQLKETKEKNTTIKEKSLELQVQEAYKEGVEALEDGDVLYAAKKFNEAEILFPQSKWAPKSALMAAYSYYSQDYLEDAIAELDRFVRVYPKYKNIDYAYYLMTISYYELIVDEKKDLQSIINAKKYFNFVMSCIQIQSTL